jgi:hypothetical protein
MSLNVTHSAVTALFPLGSGRQHVRLSQPNLGLVSRDQRLELGLADCLYLHDVAAPEFVDRATQEVFARADHQIERI